MKGVYIMNLLAFILIMYILYLFACIIWSEYKRIPMLDAMSEVLNIVLDKLKIVYNVLFDEQNVIIYYPTYIGYDSGGIFYSHILMREFQDLRKIFDGLYYTHRLTYPDIEFYYFKYARILEEGSRIELTRYTDVIVEGIITNYLGRMGWCAIPNVSAVEIGEGELCIGIARTQKGQAYNEEFKQSHYVALNEIENQSKTERPPIQTEWDDLLF